jgi:hypothetical protein
VDNPDQALAAILYKAGIEALYAPQVDNHAVGCYNAAGGFPRTRLIGSSEHPGVTSKVEGLGPLSLMLAYGYLVVKDPSPPPA